MKIYKLIAFIAVFVTNQLICQDKIRWDGSPLLFNGIYLKRETPQRLKNFKPQKKPIQVSIGYLFKLMVILSDPWRCNLGN